MPDQNQLLSMAQSVCRKYYREPLKVEVLPGELDHNFAITFSDGVQAILKVMHAGATWEQIDFQVQLLAHLNCQQLDFKMPSVIPNRNGKLIDSVRLDGEEGMRQVWMLDWIPGRLWADVTPKSKELRASLGQQLGILSNGLDGFDHPFGHRFLKWDPRQTSWVRDQLALLTDPRQLETANYFLSLFEERVVPLEKQLPKSITYGDANDYNILVDELLDQPRVRSFIDYGDAVYTYTANELAIACAYAAMDLEDPLKAVLQISGAYHARHPLTDEELSSLFPLIGARLLISVICSAINKVEHPDNEYLHISEKPAWDLLYRLKKVNPNLAYYSLRHACGLEACPQALPFQQWARHQKATFRPVVIPQTPYRVLDLSVGSLDLGNNEHFEDNDRFERKIEALLEGQTGIGGYGEARPFYTTTDYQTISDDGPVWRTVHLGIDIWSPSGTAVYAPFAGVVHSIRDNVGDRNYGPTIILEHQPEDAPKFYTLYGHLSRSSLRRLQPGQFVLAGQEIATIGPRPENGNWPPHLHFQVMLDLLGEEGDFPGVAFPEEREVWLSICPNPQWILNTNMEDSSSSRSATDILATRKDHIGPNLSISYRQHLHIVRGYKQYLYSEDGRRYLDMVNNVAHVGHEHPHVVRATQRQTGVLNTNSRYLHRNLIDYAEALLAKFPEELSVCYFVNSGSEANELALRMARTITGYRDLIAVEVGYHGNTTGCIDVSSYKFDGKGGSGSPRYTHIAPIPDTYRGLYRRADAAAGEKYAAHIAHAIDELKGQGSGIAGFICESILSCGGQIVLPTGYLAAAFESVRNAGGICIMDEVQVGFGRVGSRFWGFELQNVIPDIVTLGKPIGNGHPLGAVVTTRAVADAFANGMEFFSTFGGNPVSCAVGKAVLEVIEQEGLQAKALDIGQYLMTGLRQLQDQYPLIGDVRGAGLFLGFELIDHRKGLTPAAHQASYLTNRMRQKGVLLSTDGPDENVIKIKPPLCFDKENVDFVIGQLDLVLREDFLQL